MPCITIVDNNERYVMEIHSYDSIKVGDKEFLIDIYLYQYLIGCEDDDENYDTIWVVLLEIETTDETVYSGQEFIDMLEGPDITYTKSLLRNF